jgi:hypothetical protein
MLVATSASSCTSSRPLRDPEQTVTPSNDQADLPSCGESAPGSRQLESYFDVEVPAIYWIDLVFDVDEWGPPATLPMPYHHATRLELVNTAEFPSLSAHRAQRIRFTLKIESREIHQVADRRQWRATYHAEILSACIPRDV